MATIEASVVMPAYNQREALQIVLESFAHQRDVQGLWELILVDDGSEDGTRELVESHKAPHRLTYVRQQHSGRAAARNAGVSHAQGHVVVFCDSDRAVCNDFIANHLEQHSRHHNLVAIGGVWEFYISDLAAKREALLAGFQNDLVQFQHLARQPVYVRTVCRMFDGNGRTGYAMPWIAFFSGNVSVRTAHVRECGAFDEQFAGWGFEHFELGYRLYKSGAVFVYEPGARNYHFAHQRPPGFYEQSVEDSFAYFRRKHPVIDIILLQEFLYGRLSLQEYHNHLVRERGGVAVSEDTPVYYRQLATGKRRSS